MAQVTNFPFGVTSFGVPVVPSAPVGVGGPGGGSASTGQMAGSQVFFVNSAVALAADGASSAGQTQGGQGKNPYRPFKTINFASKQCIANNGDVIYVGPQHVETISAAASLNMAVAGVTVIFLGNEVDRGTINFTATAGTVTVTAANVTFVNPMFTNSIDALVNGVVVSAADFKIISGEWRDGSATNTLIQIRTTAAGTRMQILGYKYYEDQVGGGTTKTEAIRIVGG